MRNMSYQIHSKSLCPAPNGQYIVDQFIDPGKVGAIVLTKTDYEKSWSYDSWSCKPRIVSKDEMAETTLAEGTKRSI